MNGLELNNNKSNWKRAISGKTATVWLKMLKCYCWDVDCHEPIVTGKIYLSIVQFSPHSLIIKIAIYKHIALRCKGFQACGRMAT